MSGKIPTGRPHQKTLDWMIYKVNGKMYGHRKEKAQWTEKRERTALPAFGQRT